MAVTSVARPLKESAEFQARSESWGARVWRRYRRQPAAQIATAGLLIIILLVLLADVIAPFDPNRQFVVDRLRPPIWEAGSSPSYVLGTDAFGRDLLSRMLHGGRISLLVGFVCATISVVIGIVLGLIAGFTNGSLLDRFILRFGDVWIAFPFLVLAIAVIAVIGSDLPVLILLLSVFGWVFPCRVTRAQTMRLKNIDYVLAAHALGAGNVRIVLRHILPNVLAANLVLWTILLGSLILVESSLSFLGFGVQPPTPTWGNLLSDGRRYIERAWWISVFPGLAIAITVLLVNTLGDAMRDILDPRLTHE